MWFRARLHLVSRFVVALLALAALAPTVSRAVAFADPDARWLNAICSVGDASMPASPGDDLMLAGVDCPACLLQALPMLPPPPATLSARLPLELRDVPPSRSGPGLRPLEARAGALPRAPPALA